jgi:branched-chain amino acid transport system substrate-binding protein
MPRPAWKLILRWMSSKSKRLPSFTTKGDYGKGLAEFAKAFLEQEPNAEIVLYEGITPGAVDYSAVVQKIKRANAEAVIFGGYHPEASKIVTQMRKKRMDTIFISDDGVKDDTFIKVAQNTLKVFTPPAPWTSAATHG